MSIFGDYGSPEFGLDDVKVGTHDADGTYTGLVDVPSVQLLNMDLQTISAILEGDDRRTDMHAIAIGGTVRFRFGSIPFDALEILTGKTAPESGTTPSRQTSLTFDNLSFPYFGLCGKAVATRGTGDTHLFLPQLKIMEGFTVNMEYGAYSIPELTCVAIKDDTLGYIAKIIRHETAAAVALPPTGV